MFLTEENPKGEFYYIRIKVGSGSTLSEFATLHGGCMTLFASHSRRPAQLDSYKI